MSDSHRLRTGVEPGSPHSRTMWLGIAFLVLMIVVMAIVSVVIERSMRQLYGRAIEEILRGKVAIFDAYIGELRHEAERLVREPMVMTAIADLIGAPASPATESRRYLARRMAGQRPGVVAWLVVDDEGKIVASDDASRIDQHCGWNDEDHQKLELEYSRLILPREVKEYRDGMIVCLSPWVDDFQFKAAIGWVIDPRLDLSDRLSVSDAEAACLFDRNGQLLSRPRLNSHANNSLAGDQDWQPIVLRDPGFEMRDAVKLSGQEWAARPLTKMAEKAIRGSSGLDMDGYADYRGVSVCGVWQWLSEYHLGMAMEADKDVAFASVRLLNLLIVCMSVLLAGLGICVAILAIRTRQLRNRLQARETAVRRLGQYELTELLGVGGMGSVYRGRHQFLRRDVAIKVLEGEQLSKQAITRFRREVQLTSHLRHPNTIAIYDYGQVEDLSRSGLALNASASQIAKAIRDPNATDKADPEPSDEGGIFYYVMEYIDGISLQQLIDFYGPQTPERTVHLLLQICGSIAEAHQAGLIHRDIKPGNILLCAQSSSYDHIKVLDFGLVKDTNAVETIALTMTQSNSITGTPLYMAPETIRDATLASRSGDLYSIGAVAYALITGKPTYEGDSAIDLCLKQLERPPIPPDERLGRRLPEPLQKCIMKCLSINPKDRPASVAELVQELDAMPESSGWHQIDAADWWENVFEANRQRTPVETKSKTVVNQPLDAIGAR
ncbi:serine/threonine-protein kinase [Neorhodopirellula pilleata]|nr:serine/threonine-protein kinase [Neorhodopirellula pilleata]